MAIGNTVPHMEAIGAHAAPSVPREINDNPFVWARCFAARLWCWSHRPAAMPSPQKSRVPRDPRKQHFLRFFSKWKTILRAAPQSGKGGTARATTVKSSKSNTSDRMGGGGGKSYDNENPRPTSRGTTTATVDPARDSMEVGAASKLPSRLSPQLNRDTTPLASVCSDRKNVDENRGEHRATYRRWLRDGGF